MNGDRRLVLATLAGRGGVAGAEGDDAKREKKWAYLSGVAAAASLWLEAPPAPSAASGPDGGNLGNSSSSSSFSLTPALFNLSVWAAALPPPTPRLPSAVPLLPRLGACRRFRLLPRSRAAAAMARGTM